MKRLLWVLPAVLLLAACSGAGSTTSAPAAQFGTSGQGSTTLAAGKAGAPPQQQGSDVANGVPIPAAFDPTRSIIFTANIAMKSSDPWALADQAQNVAIGLGGDVVGLTGLTTGYHLHWAVYKNGEPIDPLSTLGG